MIGLLRDFAGLIALLAAPALVLCLARFFPAQRTQRLSWRPFLLAWAASLTAFLIIEGGPGYARSLRSGLGNYGVAVIGTSLPALAATLVLRSRYALSRPRLMASAAFILAAAIAMVAPPAMLVAACVLTGECP